MSQKYVHQFVYLNNKGVGRDKTFMLGFRAPFNRYLINHKDPKSITYLSLVLVIQDIISQNLHIKRLFICWVTKSMDRQVIIFITATKHV